MNGQRSGTRGSRASDRLFGTFTPSRHGTAIAYGLDGLDDPGTHITIGLLRLPFRATTEASSPTKDALSPERY